MPVAVAWDRDLREGCVEMAKKVTISFVDDLDGKTGADETVGFALDGVTYAIDLSTRNAKKLRASFQPWIEAGRRVGGRRRSATVGASRTATEPRESAAIRAWARKHGYQVASRGRIPADVVDAFRAAG
jgi:Lsr2